VTIGVAALVVARGEALALASSGYDMGDIKVMACFGVTEGEINGTPPVLWRLDISSKKKMVFFFFLKGGSEIFFLIPVPRGNNKKVLIDAKTERTQMSSCSEREQQKSIDRHKNRETPNELKKVFFFSFGIFFHDP
jgi:hypothetical protein